MRRTGISSFFVLYLSLWTIGLHEQSCTSSHHAHTIINWEGFSQDWNADGNHRSWLQWRSQTNSLLVQSLKLVSPKVTCHTLKSVRNAERHEIRIVGMSRNNLHFSHHHHLFSPLFGPYTDKSSSSGMGIHRRNTYIMPLCRPNIYNANQNTKPIHSIHRYYVSSSAN